MFAQIIPIRCCSFKFLLRVKNRHATSLREMKPVIFTLLGNTVSKIEELIGYEAASK